MSLFTFDPQSFIHYFQINDSISVRSLTIEDISFIKDDPNLVPIANPLEKAVTILNLFLSCIAKKASILWPDTDKIEARVDKDLTLGYKELLTLKVSSEPITVALSSFFRVMQACHIPRVTFASKQEVVFTGVLPEKKEMASLLDAMQKSAPSGYIVEFSGELPNGTINPKNQHFSLVSDETMTLSLHKLNLVFDNSIAFFNQFESSLRIPAWQKCKLSDPSIPHLVKSFNELWCPFLSSGPLAKIQFIFEQLGQFTGKVLQLNGTYTFEIEDKTITLHTHTECNFVLRNDIPLTLNMERLGFDLIRHSKEQIVIGRGQEVFLFGNDPTHLQEFERNPKTFFTNALREMGQFIPIGFKYRFRTKWRDFKYSVKREAKGRLQLARIQIHNKEDAIDISVERASFAGTLLNLCYTMPDLQVGLLASDPEAKLQALFCILCFLTIEDTREYKERPPYFAFEIEEKINALYRSDSAFRQAVFKMALVPSLYEIYSQIRFSLRATFPLENNEIWPSEVQLIYQTLMELTRLEVEKEPYISTVSKVIEYLAPAAGAGRVLS